MGSPEWGEEVDSKLPRKAAGELMGARTENRHR